MLDVAHQGAFGAIAAWGFGVLFNFDWRSLIWCSALGALALAVRTLALAGGWSLEAASFTAALAAGTIVALTSPAARRGRRRDRARRLHPDGAGRLLRQGDPRPVRGDRAGAGASEETAIFAIVAMTRVILTLGAIGAGLAIPTQMTRHRGF